MTMIDLRQGSDASVVEFDICIIGSGPAGLSVATQFFGTGVRVCLLESGGMSEASDAEALSAFDSKGMRRAEATRRRGFGGTSRVWTGRCGVFDAIDYQARPWVPFSGWPISHDDVAPYIEKAGRLLGLGPILTEDNWREMIRRPCDDAAWDSQLFQPVLFQFSRTSSASADTVRTFAEGEVGSKDKLGALQHSGAPMAVDFGKENQTQLERSENIQVFLHANATEIEVSEDGTKVKSVTVRTLTGKIMVVRSEVVVLAAGGIDNARILLASKGHDQNGLGNGKGAVGRFLADHPLGFVGLYAGEGSRTLRRMLGHRWLDQRGQRHVYSLGLRLSPELQRREQLLNCSFHLIEYGHRLPGITLAGRFLREMRSRGMTSQARGDLLGTARDPLGVLRGVYDRYIIHQPTLTVPDTVAVCCVVEQQLDPESRVGLSERLDQFGMPRAMIDWRVADADFHTARRGTETLFGEMKRLGLQIPEMQPWLSEGPDAFRAEIHDMAHPMCSTRMSKDASSGTVDENCQVHGISGLFVAGSSVFSTPGYMNPTLMIVSLALRLAEHIKQVHFRRDAAVVAQACPKSDGGHRVRIGLVGAGARMRQIYLPILRSLDEEFEIVGFTGRNRDKALIFAEETGLAHYPDAATLVEKARPDFVVAAVSPNATDQAFPALVKLPCPVLLETPFCWSVNKGRKLLRRNSKDILNVGVAEQTPFLPVEQMKRRLIQLGLIGRISGVYNDFSVYDYHGIAALRAYVGPGNRAVRGNCVTSPVIGLSARKDSESWMLGTLTMEDGALLNHHYSPDYNHNALRRAKFFRVCGTSGSIVDNEVAIEDGTTGGKVSTITRHCVDGRLQRLSLETPIGIVVWNNPFSMYPFSDEQIAVATHLRAMANMAQNGGLPLYMAGRSLEDMEILKAFKVSAAAMGRAFNLPVPWTSLVLDTVRQQAAPLFSRLTKRRTGRR